MFKEKRPFVNFLEQFKNYGGQKQNIAENQSNTWLKKTILKLKNRRYWNNIQNVAQILPIFQNIQILHLPRPKA